MPRARRHPARNETEFTDVIVISGVLLLVAVVFLVIGLFGSLAWVYASIGVSVASFVFLLLGVRQRRGSAPEIAPVPGGLSRLGAVGATPTADRDEDVTVVPPTAAPEAAPAALAGAAAGAGAGAAASSRPDATAALRRTATTSPQRTTAKTTTAKSAAKSATAKSSAAARSTTKSATTRS